jgi:predicted enzyme related to lactoylglutathione lyase
MMTNPATAVVNKPAWVDLGTSDPSGAREFYSALFGWDIQVNPDPQYGGYGRAVLDGKDVAGIGPAMSPQQPTAWSVYIGTDDAEALSKKVVAAGGQVLMPAFDVGDQGRMAVFADPGGAAISAWQPTTMGGFGTQGANAFSWAELNARGVTGSLGFYHDVFGWALKSSDSPDFPYTEFQVDGRSIAGATEMSAMAPAEMPNYWLVYFGVDDVDAATSKAVDAGGKQMLAPMDFPGGRFSLVADPQGAIFGLMRLTGA